MPKHPVYGYESKRGETKHPMWRGTIGDNDPYLERKIHKSVGSYVKKTFGQGDPKEAEEAKRDEDEFQKTLNVRSKLNEDYIDKSQAEEDANYYYEGLTPQQKKARKKRLEFQNKSKPASRGGIAEDIYKGE